MRGEVEAKVLMEKKTSKERKEKTLASLFLPCLLPPGTHLARDLDAMAVVFLCEKSGRRKRERERKKVKSR